MPRKNTTVSVHDLPAPTAGVPEWMAKLRQAAQARIHASDIEAIVDKQIERAKEGDDKAIKFVFDQVLGGSAFKGATFHQEVHHHHAAEHPACRVDDCDAAPKQHGLCASHHSMWVSCGRPDLDEWIDAGSPLPGAWARRQRAASTEGGAD